MATPTTARRERGMPAMTDIIDKLAKTIASRKGADPEASYVASLHAQGTEKILEKIEEEAGELIEAARTGSAPDITHETADLWFHSLVLLASLDIPPTQVLAELERRFGVSGHAEKASRKS